jgi:hypothetical protein
MAWHNGGRTYGYHPSREGMARDRESLRDRVIGYCLRQRIAFTEQDVDAAVRYLRGRRTCAEFDALSSWVKAIIDGLTSGFRRSA